MAAKKKKVDIRSYFSKKPVSHKVKITTEMSPITTLMTTRLWHTACLQKAKILCSSYS